jgi:hypothetical protein
VERTTVAPGAHLLVGSSGFRERPIARHRHDGPELGTELLEPFEIRFRERQGRNLPRAHELAQLTHRAVKLFFVNVSNSMH